ncbi:MAG: amino acid ABC transporter permease [Clostridia bacterium]|nr:amino acid ABC transporter permease [Clostridia bacterium]
MIFKILKQYASLIFEGVGYTMLVAIFGTIIGLLIGLLIGVYRTIPSPRNKALRILKKVGDVILSVYIEVFRGTPMMVQALVIYFGFAFINGGMPMDVTFSALLIVSINTGAYMAEIVRGGIISIDKGQFEGAHAIGMGHGKTMFYIVIPQALRNILPSVSNEFIINIKDTSVLNVIGFTELFFQAKTIDSMTYETFATYLLIAIVYFVLTFSISSILRLIEKKMDGKKHFAILGSQSDRADVVAANSGGESNE